MVSPSIRRRMRSALMIASLCRLKDLTHVKGEPSVQSIIDIDQDLIRTEASKLSRRECGHYTYRNFSGMVGLVYLKRHLLGKHGRRFRVQHVEAQQVLGP